MKKTTMLFLMFVMVIFLSGCSGSENGDTATGDNETSGTESPQNKDDAGPVAEEKDQDTSSGLLNIKDKNMEKALRNILNKGSGDITVSDMEKIKEADLSKKDIVDISGLEYAVNLQYLNLRENKVADISPLKNLERIERLILDTNKIVDISPLTGLKSVKALELKGNKINDITAVRWENLKDLNFLDIRYNFIDLNDSSTEKVLEKLFDSGVDVWHEPLEPLFNDWQ